MLRLVMLKPSPRIYNPYILNTVITFEEIPVTAEEIETRINTILKLGYPYIVDGTKRAGDRVCLCRSSGAPGLPTNTRLKPAFTSINHQPGKGLGKILYKDLLSGYRIWISTLFWAGSPCPTRSVWDCTRNWDLKR